ncbi:hypothetical protein [Brevibacterium metallidurans]
MTDPESGATSESGAGAGSESDSASEAGSQHEAERAAADRTNARADTPDGENAISGSSDEGDDEREKKARLERALRAYRATLRNEAESGTTGFSAEHYRSQKPPHW